MTKATSEEVNDVRVGLLLYYDDLEVCSPLGFAKGKHKVGCFYYAIINLPARERHRHRWPVGLPTEPSHCIQQPPALDVARAAIAGKKAEESASYLAQAQQLLLPLHRCTDRSALF
jgi:hypothetical protein